MLSWPVWRAGTGSLLRDRRGAIGMIAAIALPFAVGIVGLAIEYGNGLLTKADNQRVADAAAFSAGLAYTASRTAGAADPTIAATSAALRIAALNGMAGSAVATTYLVSPRGTGNPAVQVTVTTSVALMFSRMLGTGSTLSVPAAATAEIAAGAQGCVFALKAAPGTGVTMSGGTALTAPTCAVASNSTLSAPCGTTITAAAITYNSASVPSQPCAGLRGPGGGAAPLATKVLADPLAGNAAIATAAARIATVAALVSPSAPAAPSVNGSNGIDFGYNILGTQFQAGLLGCTASFNLTVWTLNCPAGNRTFATFTLQGGIRVNFMPGGVASNVYSFKTAVNTGTGAGAAFGPGTYVFASDFQTGGGGSNSFASGNVTIGGTLINQSSGPLTFGSGTFNIRGGIYNDQGGSLTFGSGTFNVGTAGGNYSCGANYSLCVVSGSVGFGGPGTFNFAAGIGANNGTRVTLGSGTNNSYRIGPNSYNYAISGGAGSTLIFADATSAGNVFESNGWVVSNPGTCIVLPAAAQHDIDGSIDVGGGIVFGAGVYTVNGYVAFGQAGGGPGTCNGVATSVQASGVTLVVSGLSQPTSGICTGQSFCVAAGFSNLVITAPVTGATANLVLIGPQGTAVTAQNTSGAVFADGASNANISGSFYYPHGAITLGGGAGIGDKTGQCLTLIGAQITLTGGTVAASTCAGSGGAGSGGGVTLIR